MVETSASFSRKRVESALRICASEAIFSATSVSHRVRPGVALARNSAKRSALSTPSRECASHSSGNVGSDARSEEHTSELQSQSNLVCRLLLEKKTRLGARMGY